MGTTQDFSYLEPVSDGGRLILCKGIADTEFIEQCEVTYPVKNIYDPVPVKFPLEKTKRDNVLFMSPLINNNSLTSFTIVDPQSPSDVIVLPPACVRALKWPFQM